MQVNKFTRCNFAMYNIINYDDAKYTHNVLTQFDRPNYTTHMIFIN